MNRTICTGDIVLFSCQGFLQNGDPLDINESQEPLRLQAGKETGHPMRKRLALALVGLRVDAQRTVAIPFLDGFGKWDDRLVAEIGINSFPPEITVGSIISIVVDLLNKNEEREGKILSIGKENVQVDFNHEYAGHNLSFEISVISFEPPKHTSR